MSSPRYKKLWMGLCLLILLSPLGLILPEKFNTRAAWGEWSAKELKSMLGYVPEKLEQLEGIWKAIFPDYGMAGMKKPWQAKLAYVLSGIIGVSAIVAICFGLGKWLSVPEDRKDNHAS
jgi:cobalt/nickel transport protein